MTTTGTLTGATQTPDRDFLLNPRGKTMRLERRCHALAVYDAVGWAICGLYDLTPGELTSTVRLRRYSRPRQELYYYINKVGRIGTPVLKSLLDRDHKTIWHGIRQHKKRMVQCHELTLRRLGASTNEGANTNG